MLKTALQFIYPSRCRSCNDIIQRDAFLCASCLVTVKPVVSLYVPLTKKQVVRVYAAGAYQAPLRSMILRKIGSDVLASKQLGSFMLNMIPFHTIACDLLVPIPLHWTRYARRGYNQAAEMAKVIGKGLGVPVVPMLARKKRTVFQSTLSSSDRQGNVHEAFCLRWRYRWRNPAQFKDKHIVIVDDLYTTGATARSAAQALFAYKPASITVVVACRAL